MRLATDRKEDPASRPSSGSTPHGRGTGPLPPAILPAARNARPDRSESWERAVPWLAGALPLAYYVAAAHAHGGFFEEGEAEPGFAGSGQAEDDAVGDEVLGIIEDQIILHHLRLRIVAAPQIKLPEFFVIRRGNAHDARMLEELRKNSSRKMGRQIIPMPS